MMTRSVSMAVRQGHPKFPGPAFILFLPGPFLVRPRPSPATKRVSNRPLSNKRLTDGGPGKLSGGRRMLRLVNLAA